MLALASLALAVTLGTDSAAVVPVDPSRVVSVRLHDYAQVSDEDLLAAEHEVSAIYETAGVHVVWREPVRPELARRALVEWPTDPPAELSVLIVPSARARGIGVRSDVAGYAPMEAGAAASLVFVVADRTHRAAILANVLHSCVLARVIAHELAHIFMPTRAHTRDGIFRAQWRPGEFGIPLSSIFSAAEIDEIRRAVAERANSSHTAAN